MLTAMAMATERVRLGHMVVCTELPQPGRDGQDGLDDRRHQRRPLRARHRGRLEGRRVAGLRLRLPAARRADRRLRRPPRGHHPDVRPGPRHVRGRARQRDATRSTSREGLQQPRIPIIVGGNGRGSDGRSGHPLRRRAELRVPGAAEVAERIAEVRARCEARGPRPGDAAVLALHPRRGRATTRASARIDQLAAMAEAGLDRLVAFPTRWSPTEEAQAAFADDCRGGRAQPGGAGRGRLTRTDPARSGA